MLKIAQASRLPARLTLLFVAAALMGMPPAAHGQTFSTLYSFQCQPDGYGPTGTLTLDAEGNLYGTTESGGTYDEGTVFKISPQGVETVLHSFGFGDGAQPQDGTLVFDSAGNLYGTTVFGGPHSDRGTVFKLAPDGTLTTIHNFTGPDGSFPYGLSIDQNGNLYGTAYLGGTYGQGTVFEITLDGLKTLYNLPGAPGPAQAVSGVIVDSEGNIYGTSIRGGSESAGTAFELNAAGEEKLLLNVHGITGNQPEWGLLRTPEGYLYGTSIEGGPSNAGLVWAINNKGTTTVVHDFGGVPDGAAPTGPLVEDSAGNFYGTTASGGTGEHCRLGCGTIFEINSAGVESVLYSLPEKETGNTPQGGLVVDGQGNLYGTTLNGGTGHNCGTVFKLTPAADE